MSPFWFSVWRRLGLALWADTIHLKNGRKIVADHVRENGNRYEYEVGDDSYAIPRSAVDHVEAGGVPARSAVTEKLGDLPSFDSTAGSLAKKATLPQKSSVMEKSIRMA